MSFQIEFNMKLHWKGGFEGNTWRDGLGRLVYSGGSVHLGGHDKQVPVTPQDDMYVPRCEPFIKYATNPFREWSENKDYASLDCTRIVERGLVPHGQGTLSFQNTVFYHGGWYEGYRHGQGMQLIYEERVLNSKMTEANGPIYIGVYTGMWRYGARFGYGEMVFKSGIEYKGEWKDDEICGVGSMLHPDGSALFATFEAGVPVGSGVWVWSDGSQELHIYTAKGKLQRTKEVKGQPKSLLMLKKKIEAARNGQRLTHYPAMNGQSPQEAQTAAVQEPFRAPQRAPVAAGLPAAAGSGGARAGGGGGGARPMPVPRVGVGALEPASLKLKRKLKDFCEQGLAVYDNQCNAVGIGPIKWSVKEDSFANDPAGGTAINALVGQPQQVVQPLMATLQAVADDEFGKEALQEEVSSIVLVNAPSARQVTYDLSNNTLTVKLKFCDRNQRVDQSRLQKFFDDNLG